jgi:hypothetical protein
MGTLNDDRAQRLLSQSSDRDPQGATGLSIENISPFCGGVETDPADAFCINPVRNRREIAHEPELAINITALVG